MTDETERGDADCDRVRAAMTSGKEGVDWQQIEQHLATCDACAPGLARLTEAIQQQFAASRLLDAVESDEQPDLPLAGGADSSTRAPDSAERIIEFPAATNVARARRGPFRNRLLVALIYPTILVIVVTSILAYLVTYVIPEFAKLYADLNVELPPMSRALLAVALPLRSYLFILAPGLVAVIAGLSLWSRSEAGGLALDRLKPRLPVLGDIWLKAQVAQFVRTLSTLLAGGTPLVAALSTAADSVGTKLMARAIRQAAEGVRQGQSLHASLAASGLMPELALEMIEVGEASGALPSMLGSVAEFYEEEVNLRLAKVLAWVEPGILMVMALVVAFILISLYLPVFSLSMGAAGR